MRARPEERCSESCAGGDVEHNVAFPERIVPCDAVCFNLLHQHAAINHRRCVQVIFGSGRNKLSLRHIVAFDGPIRLNRHATFALAAAFEGTPGKVCFSAI
mmetsp:Transcript_25201/g.80111  ORF Transcript_25201/g.80111 Transcript_25201/m.80111 type:complete len:101 (+) Transcript_25201:41-343(+)